MTKSFWGFARRWVGRVRAAPRVLLALDFDGTLAPLVDHPSRARMPATLRKRLGALTDRCDVAVLSGRSLADVRKRVGVGKVFYGGNHGLEMSGPGFGYVNPTARRLKRHTGEMMRLAQEALRSVAGVHLEEKGYGLSVHYRRVQPEQMVFFKTVLSTLKRKTHARAFHWTRGHCVWELRPRVRWDKGRALRTIRRHRGRPFVIAVGDDATDEDMFRAAVGRGFAVKVGSEKTRAAYRLSRQGEVLAFLKWTLDLVRRIP